MDIDGGLVMQGFLDGMGSLLVALGGAAVVGLALGCLMIYFEHYKNNGEE
tara:strand:+ start:661 stop:810 length:150 start_codon:yes stop_codon:yes gene_type:complete